MANGMFEAAAYQDLSQINEDGGYTNARFARQGDETVGKPFHYINNRVIILQILHQLDKHLLI